MVLERPVREERTAVGRGEVELACFTFVARSDANYIRHTLLGLFQVAEKAGATTVVVADAIPPTGVLGQSLAHADLVEILHELESLRREGYVFEVETYHPEQSEVQLLTRQHFGRSMRESAAVLSQADLHLGPDSLLMHVANGLDVPAVILMGGSRPVTCLGYADNENLSSTPSCRPCWIHQGYETCEHDVKCMASILPKDAGQAIKRLLSSRSRRSSVASNESA